MRGQMEISCIRVLSRSSWPSCFLLAPRTAAICVTGGYPRTGVHPGLPLGSGLFAVPPLTVRSCLTEQTVAVVFFLGK